MTQYLNANENAKQAIIEQVKEDFKGLTVEEFMGKYTFRFFETSLLKSIDIMVALREARLSFRDGSIETIEL